MKAKLDENLPLQIAPCLRNLGHDVQTTKDEGLSGCNDFDLWTAAQSEGRTLITQDMDFSDSRRFAPGTHHGIFADSAPFTQPSGFVRTGGRAEEVFRNEKVSAWHGCFVVVTERKVRVRRAPIRPH
ncbi:MAG: DUF5615 family PIN-like protein [Candidatus Koribacter versatilis]|nr:DUF5615 family PIN-like protein [Candidatus Koribacter versatilis]